MKKYILQLPKKWAYIALVNFLIAAVLGFLLRYKMSYSLKFINYNHLLHAHSHFVFHAWAGLAIMGAFIKFLLPKEKSEKSAYGWIFWAMIFSSFGMLISFIIQGYGFFSILFSTLAQVVYYWFIIQFIIDGRKSIENKTVKLFAFSALITLFISTFGPYFLAYFTAHASTPLLTKSALYFYLHFQYNGWFSFGIMALFLNWLHHQNLIYQPSIFKWIALLFIIGVVPGFSISIIGYVKSTFVIINAYIAVITKIIAVILFFISILKVRKELCNLLPSTTRILWGLSGIALLFKTIMEALSLDPKLASFAFTFRPLVIGYLHLIFLVMITFFLIGYFFEKKQLIYKHTGIVKYGLWIFVLATILSELFLFLQAFSFFFSIRMSFVNKSIFWATTFILLSLFLFVISQTKYKKENKLELN